MADLNDKAAKNRVEGLADEAKGRVQSAAGALTGDNEQKVKGEFEQLKGKAKQALGDVQNAADRAFNEKDDHNREVTP